MKYNNIEFDAIMATPGVGKSFLCDNDKRFIDADEERLRCKYYVPDDISRIELERTKGNRTFKKRVKDDEYINMLYKKLEDSEGKIAHSYTELDEIVQVILRDDVNEHIFVRDIIE